MGSTIWKAALIGAAQGAAECTILFLSSERRTLANDWFLAVMVIFANASGLAVASRYGVGLIGVAIAGLAGMMFGGWVGVHTIGTYEYTVPTPKEDREMRIIAKGQERVIELKGAPEEKVKRIPVGGGLGVLVGWAFGAGIYAWLRRPQEEGRGGSGVEAFPFNDAEWDRVKEAILPVINATFAEDEVLRASCFMTLQEVLGELRARYGDHPVLIETEADFTEDNCERVRLYRRAVIAACSHGMPTLTIRLSLARVLLELGQPDEAATELSACESELPNGDESDRTSWSALTNEAKHAEPHS